ncbi:P-loop containing nucleoside triphosphate hydrolase protein, partial [Mycena pura]
RRRRSHRPPTEQPEGSFDPEDTSKVRHTKIGVWYLYEQKAEIEPSLKLVPGFLEAKLIFEKYHEMKGSFPYVWRMLKEIASIRACWWPFAGYFQALTLKDFSLRIDAEQIYRYSGQLLNSVQNAVQHRTVDRHVLFKVAASRLICSAVSRLLRFGEGLLYRPLNERILRHYAVQSFRARARLDVPTYSDSAILRQLDNSSTSSRTSVAWTNFSVLVNMLGAQRDGPLLATLSFGHALFRKKTDKGMTSLHEMVHDQQHRKEIVAGGLAEYLVSSYGQAVQRLGSNAVHFFEAYQVHTRSNRLRLSTFLSDSLRELPQIVFTLRAVQYPSDIPLSLASLNLITQTTSRFSRTLFDLFEQTGSVAENLASIRKMYETYSIPNVVVDGNKPFPEDQRSLDMGISIEFRNVSFRYPGSKQEVLRNVSFKIQQEIGVNGSGKSTILKLIARLYDPTDGSILINDQDIQTFRIPDLRRATSVLFQDYTHFPLSIKDNIGLGDLNNACDEEKIREAARLGGAADFIERLDEGFDTFLVRPVKDVYSQLPQGRSVEYSCIRFTGNMSTHSKELSGGQMQRIALSRTFMRSEGVGLLCFDEPSASLDPAAEHDLFERLRLLRGNKTMIFSSHRFGNLTRHADRILTAHDELMKKGGGYAKIWMLQAQAFLA